MFDTKKIADAVRLIREAYAPLVRTNTVCDGLTAIIGELDPQAKPLLADAQVGDLCKHRNGDWSQIIDTNGTYIPGQPIRTTLKDTNGINRNFCLSGSHFTMQFGGEYDIIATEPLATEGTAEWAWQMMLLGNKVWNPELDLHKAKRTMSQVLSIYYIDGGNIMVRNLSGERSVLGVQKDSYWAVYAESTGWQLYAEPEPDTQYKVGDWVEFRDIEGIKHGVVDGIYDEYSVNYGGTSQSVSEKYITRKLDPSEVIVKIGCLKGTVAHSSSSHFCLCAEDNWTMIAFDMLDTPTRELVESLLKAQEEK